MDSSAATNDELQRRVRQQEVLAELGQRALESDDRDQLLHEASVVVAETLDGACCAVHELTSDGGDILVRQGVGWRDGIVGSSRVPVRPDSQVGYTLRSEEPVIVDDLRTEERFSGEELLSSHDVVSGMSVVIGSFDEPWGILGVHTTEPREFTEHDAHFVQSVANVLAAAIDRAGSERRLRAHEARLERYQRFTDRILDAVDDVFYVIDEDGSFRRWNDALTRVSGYADAEVDSMHPIDFFVEGDRDAISAAIAEVLETGRSRVEATVRTKGGDRIPYEFVAVSLENPEGERVITGIGRDVSVKQQQQQELALYETIVETIHDGIYVKDADARFTMVNNAYAEMTGYDPEELVGEHASLIVDEAAIDQSRAIVAEADGETGDSPPESSTGTTVEAELVTATGERVPAEGTFATIRTDEGEVLEVGVVRDLTERKRRERERQRVVSALEAAREGISLLDEGGVFIYVNRAYAETFGYSTGRMTGEHWEDLGIEADPSRFADEIFPVLDSEGQWVGTTTCVRADGSTFLARHSLTQTNDDELICVLRDVTEERERKEDLREARVQLELATKAANVGIWTWDIQNDVITADEYLAEAYGVDPDTAADGAPLQVFLDAVHGADREPVRDMLRRAVEETGEFEVEYRVVGGGEELTWMVSRAEVVYDDDGEPIQMHGAVSDITERKERERQLEESERRYRTLAENFPNGAVGVYDEDLRYTLTAGAILGDGLPDATELEGRTIEEIFPEDTIEDLKPLLEAAVEDGVTDSTMTEFDGRSWQVWATPLLDANGEIFAGLSFSQDVTDRVERERRLRELVGKLEASNERLEQFAYAASHDLQEPLRMISSYLQLVERRYADELDEDGREFIDYAVNGADRMRNMVNALLGYSRVESGGEPFEPVELDRVLDEALTNLSVQIDGRDGKVTIESLPRVRGDPDQLRQVFQNLVSNALTYSDGPPTVHVSAERADSRWVISVRDEGLGIDPEHQGRIFDVFERLHGGDEHSGTGIGLALCERIVERHGGEIWVESSRGEGSTFSFTLPVGE